MRSADQALAVLWDQGEANMDEGFMLRREQYACLFREMIGSRPGPSERGSQNLRLPTPKMIQTMIQTIPPHTRTKRGAL